MSGLVLDGAHWAETADDPALDITGDFDIRVAGTAADWTPPTRQTFVAKWQPALTQQSYGLQLESGSGGLLNAFWDDDGSGASNSRDSTAATGFTDGTLHAVRATVKVSTLEVKFYTKATTAATALADCEDNTGWAQLGATVTDAITVSVFSGNGPLRAGVVDGLTQFFIGTLYAVVVKNGINGTTVANPDFYSHDLPFTDAAGRYWTFQPPAPPTPSTATGHERRVELGCGDYKLLLTERGGKNPIAFLPFSNLSWGRVVDDASSATLTVPLGTGEAFDACCMVFEHNDSFDGEVDSFSHEISVLRDDKLVWVGPIVDMTFSFTDVQIQARDLFHWFDKRLMPISRDEIGDLASLFLMFAHDAYDLEPSPNITFSPFAVNTINRRTVLQQDYVVAGNLLREIGKDGVDFTMLGRTLYEGNLDGVASDLGIELRLPQQAIQTGTLQKRGSEMATEFTLTGRPPGGSSSTIHGTRGGKDDKYGLVQVQQSESFITVPAFLEDAANARWERIKKPPRYLDVTLDPKAPFLMEQLIAGFLIDVKCQVGCASLVEMMRLHSFQVTVRADDKGTVTETIQATIVPKGQPTFGFDLGFGGDN